MGFLDRAKETLKQATKGVGEETVRVVDYDDEEEPLVPKNPVAKKNVAKKDPSKASSGKGFSFPKMNSTKQESKPARTTKSRVPTAPKVAPPSKTNSAFDFGEDAEVEDVFESGDLHPDKEVKEEKIQDILDLLQIPSTFEIERDVFLPEDLVKVSFNMQVPQGYDMGEVSTFVSRTKISIGRLVDLLKQRNEHIAKLATTVDRLQVDLANTKFQNEVANGINVMATSDSNVEELESDNYELRLAVKRLQEELDSGGGQASDEMTESELDQFRALQDELSLMQRDNQALEEQIYDLKNQNALLIEKIDILEEDAGGYGMGSQNDTISDDYTDDALPSFEDSTLEDSSLPDIGEEVFRKEPTIGIPDPSSSSVFYSEDVESTEEFMKNNQGFQMLEEDEDDAIFADYNNDSESLPELYFDTDEDDATSLPSEIAYEDDDEDDDILDSLQDWN